MQSKIILFILAPALLVLLSSHTDISSPSFEERANQFFSKHVNNGKVAYNAVKRNPAELNALVQEIADYNLYARPSNEQLAFYLNAYNVLVIKNVIDNMPLQSPLDISGFFDKTTFTVAGKSRTLNAIENDIIRPTFKDARIHFALVCGAVGCPVITKDAFTASQLDKQLNQLTTNALNDPNFIRVNNSAKMVEISQIFEWYAVDFGDGSKSAQLDYINQYRKQAIPSDYKVAYYSYNWQLNSQ